MDGFTASRLFKLLRLIYRTPIHHPHSSDAVANATYKLSIYIEANRRRRKIKLNITTKTAQRPASTAVIKLPT